MSSLDRKAADHKLYAGYRLRPTVSHALVLVVHTCPSYLFVYHPNQSTVQSDNLRSRP